MEINISEAIKLWGSRESCEDHLHVDCKLDNGVAYLVIAYEAGEGGWYITDILGSFGDIEEDGCFDSLTGCLEYLNGLLAGNGVIGLKVSL